MLPWAPFFLPASFLSSHSIFVKSARKVSPFVARFDLKSTSRWVKPAQKSSDPIGNVALFGIPLLPFRLKEKREETRWRERQQHSTHGRHDLRKGGLSWKNGSRDADCRAREPTILSSSLSLSAALRVTRINESQILREEIPQSRQDNVSLQFASITPQNFFNTYLQ